MEIALLPSAISSDILHPLYFQAFGDVPAKYFERFR